MCSHPETLKKRRRVTSKGKSWVITDCRECFRQLYRRKQERRKAFRLLATMPVIRG